MGSMEPQNTDLKAIICLRIGPLGLMGPLFYNIVYSLFLVGHWMSAVAVSAAEIRTQFVASMAGKKKEALQPLWWCTLCFYMRHLS